MSREKKKEIMNISIRIKDEILESVQRALSNRLDKFFRALDCTRFRWSDSRKSELFDRYILPVQLLGGKG